MINNDLLKDADINEAEKSDSIEIIENQSKMADGLYFGFDCETPVDTILQNNITLFDWVERNKIYPTYCGRNITGKNALTREEVKFLADKGCNITVFFNPEGSKETEEQGKAAASVALSRVFELEVRYNKAIFMEIKENDSASKDFMKGYAAAIEEAGFIPGFKANTDSTFDFDRKFSAGMLSDPDIFGKCFVWATAPSAENYDNILTSHLISPDYWAPFAPSAITRRDIAIWQYGKNCHKIEDNSENVVVFNINLVRNVSVINENMI